MGMKPKKEKSSKEIFSLLGKEEFDFKEGIFDEESNKEKLYNFGIFGDAILNGKQVNFNHNSQRITLKNFYEMQLDNQRMMLDLKMYDDWLLYSTDDIPGDYPDMTSYHMLHLLSELGEVLEADKRWKSHRKDKNDLEEKKDEIMDLIIISLNLAIYSGMTSEELETKLKDKMLKNKDRLFKEKNLEK